MAIFSDGHIIGSLPTARIVGGTYEIPKRCILYGGGMYAPIHDDHVRLILALLGMNVFTTVRMFPSGERVDKIAYTEPNHRVAMIHMSIPPCAFTSYKTKFDPDYRDVYWETTKTIDVLEHDNPEFSASQRAWVTATDSFKPQEKYGGLCEIEARWHRGQELMDKWPFIIVLRKDMPPIEELRLPKRYVIVDIPELQGYSSTEVRNLVAAGEIRFLQMVSHHAGLYIMQQNLFGWPGRVIE